MVSGGSQAVTASPVVLSGAVPGKIKAKGVTFLNKTGNVGNISVGKSNVEADGNPAFFTLKPEATFTMLASSERHDFVEVDFRLLYVIGSSAGDILQITFWD